ncbi:MAG TPA: glycosyltransferase family 2 protein [Clostridiales bacterium]|nr:glycosyltransferase family 2 protein [Clostridiales bacterium]HQP70460.1 glycosyltransferase family 2 protein [Clostridiales bacterium]
MSSLSNLPYGKILEYWNERLKGRKHRIKFVLTKIIEIRAFTKSKEMPKKILQSEGRITESEKPNNIPSEPKLSVVVPTYIRTEFDKECMKRLIRLLLNQNYPINTILVVDDNSPVEYEVEKSERISIIKQNINQGPAKARNKGIEKSLEVGSDITIFTDVDCVPDIDWTQNIVKEFRSKINTHIVSGNAKSYNRNWLGIYHEINGTLNGRKFKDSDLLLYGPTCNLSISRNAVLELRFNEHFPNAAGEDIDFCYNAIKKGFNIRHSRKAVIRHDYGYKRFRPIQNLKMFTNQFRKYAKGEKILLEQIPDYYSYFNNTEEISSYDA